MYQRELHLRIKAAVDAQFDESLARGGSEPTLTLCTAAESNLNHWNKWSNDLGQFKNLVPQAEASLLVTLRQLAALNDARFGQIRDELAHVIALGQVNER